MNNIAPLAIELKKKIERFLTTECVGDDVSEEEETMYEMLNNAVGCIDNYLKTQKLTNRKFEVGKTYYDFDYNLKRVEKITEKGLWFKDAYGASRVSTDTKGNEKVHGVYMVNA